MKPKIKINTFATTAKTGLLSAKEGKLIYFELAILKH
jgi:hypothetical protein